MRKKKILFLIIMFSLIFVRAAIIGDVNNDGKVGVTDYILIRKHILGINILKNGNLERADVNNDSKINSLDYIAIRKIILNAQKSSINNSLNISDEDFLKVSGTKLVKVGNGNAVLLRGFNLGEWLSRAVSLSPISKAWAASSAYEREYADNNVQINYAIKKRFPNRYNELNDAYYDNFITAFDITKLREMGVNAVRVPVEWSYFVDLTFYENNYTYTYELLTGSRLESRLKRLDWIVDTCRKNGIYVIFDLHVVDGGQNNGGIRSQKGGYTFYKEEGKKSQENALKIWNIIATRFKDNPAVAGYELLNEPGPSGSDEITSYENFIKKAYNEIRNVEKNSKNKHIIIIESPMKSATEHSLNGLKTPSQYGFSNVVYSVHDYFTNNLDILPGNTIKGAGTANDVKKAVKAKVDQDVKEMKEYNIPLYVGETNFLWKDTSNVWNYAMSLYETNFISYTFWSYKVAKSTTYGLVYNLDAKSSSSADLLGDSFNDILSKFKLNTLDAKYQLNNKYYDVIKSHLINTNNKSILATTEYNCKVGDKLISTIRTLSIDGEAKLASISTSDDTIANISKINPTGKICTGSLCQTIEINCLKKGETTITSTSNYGLSTTAKVIVK